MGNTDAQIKLASLYTIPTSAFDRLSLFPTVLALGGSAFVPEPNMERVFSNAFYE
jgi:hypothetical protein